MLSALPFDCRKGFASLMVLILIAIFMNLGVAQHTYILSTLKGSHGYWRGVVRRTALLDGPHLVRLKAEPYSGKLITHDFDMKYLWYRRQSSMIKADQISVSFDNHTRWPDSVGLWIEIPNAQLFIRGTSED